MPAPIFNHSCRVWGWAATWRSADNEPVDTQLLLAACLLHDVGLAMASPATGRSCFTVRSAEKAASVLTRAGFSAGS
ncbi:HD domain-containing protein, partial [Mycobacterium kansasii]